ncbi:MAG: hypothetical protein PHN44_00545 [Candidatus Marinimicrobia bacterium]|nr:hypothetical protein [Candidatus Neomarinimicrobiota bacterium]MDD5539146.1 hypothetical protein [Candidatus Neomarinimicrobiota bacterium]
MPDLYRKSDSTTTSEVLPPEIKIVQGTSQGSPEGAKMGQFYNSISGECFDEFDFIFVDRDKTRTYWGRETIEDEPPLCWSPDADSNVSANGDNCLKCPHRADNAASLPPAVRRTKCLVHYTIKGIKLPNWEPFMMRVTGISTGEFMRLMSNFLYNPALRNPETGKPMYHSVVVPAKTAKVVTPSGPSYALKFGMFKPIAEQDVLSTSLSVSAELLGQGDALLQLEEGTPENTSQEIKTETPPPASIQPPKVRVINDTPPQTQALKDADSLYEKDTGETEKKKEKRFIGYLEDGKEIYAGDLVPAGAVVLKEKPAPKIAAPAQSANIPPATPPKKATPIDIGSL